MVIKTYIIRLLNYDPEKRDSYVIIGSSFFLLLIYRYFGSAPYFLNNFSAVFSHLKENPSLEYYAYLYQFASFFLLMFVLPLIYAQLVMKIKWKDLGFSLGDTRAGWKIIVFSIPLFIIPSTWIAAHSEALRNFYPLCRLILERKDLLATFEILWVFLYFIPWEFYFRGFMLFPLVREFGAFNAILIQTMASALVHIGTPADEAFAAAFGGILFGLITVRTGSFWYAFILHASVAVAKDVLIVYTT